MALIDLKRDASDSELRVFACALFPLFAAVVGALVVYNWQAWTAASALWAAAGVLFVVGLVKPAAVKPLFLLWMWAAYPIGWTVGHLLMAAVYYGLFTPVALVMRIVGYDPMQRRIDRAAKTYWTPRRQPVPLDQYFRQF